MTHYCLLLTTFYLRQVVFLFRIPLHPLRSRLSPQALTHASPRLAMPRHPAARVCHALPRVCGLCIWVFQAPLHSSSTTKPLPLFTAPFPLFTAPCRIALRMPWTLLVGRPPHSMHRHSPDCERQHLIDYPARRRASTGLQVFYLA